MTIKQVKELLGSAYLYERLLSDKEVIELLQQPPRNVSSCTAASLRAGCMRIDAVLYPMEGLLKLGYDIFVKDDPDSSEWICYDSLEETKSLTEEGLFHALDRVVQENDLSYTDCVFEQLDGKLLKKEAAITIQQG